MRNLMLAGVAIVFLFTMTVGAHATLTTIGTASYLGGDYNLIWDDDNNGNSVVWLDYSYSHENGNNTWPTSVAWAENLDGALTLNLNPGYAINWSDSTWRLPTTVDGVYVHGWDGTTTAGYSITTSEFGHLFYEELNGIGHVTTSGTVLPSGSYGLMNTGDFENLGELGYWSGTLYADTGDQAWYFEMFSGRQRTFGFYAMNLHAMAVRTGEVSNTAPVPEPATIMLLSIGLIGLARGVGRKRG